MKVTFYSNFLTHHQIAFCLEMQKRLGNDFKFVSTVKIFQWRLDLGFEDLDSKYDFVIKSYENEQLYNEAKRLAIESDVVIIGSTTDELIEERLKLDKLTFRYRARIFMFPDGVRKTIFNKEKIKLFYNRHIKYRHNKNLYLLCANAYGARDFNLFGLYKNKTYKWGYFLENDIYNIDDLIKQKEDGKLIKIIWVARFIKWKNPKIVIKLAKYLKSKKYNFEIQMLGNGVLFEKINKRIIKENLEDVIELVGNVQSSKVNDYMQKSNIFIATSNKSEGWGMVINEAMNAGCAIVANKRMGSVPILIEDKKTGFSYNKFDDFKDKVELLINDRELREKFYRNAYDYICTEWTASIATQNLLELFNSIINNREPKIKSGPASKL